MDMIKIITFITVIHPFLSKKCKENESWQPCWDKFELCEQSCDNLEEGKIGVEWFCRKLCKPRCICKMGYVRDHRSGACVDEIDGCQKLDEYVEQLDEDESFVKVNFKRKNSAMKVISEENTITEEDDLGSGYGWTFQQRPRTWVNFKF